jgi:hypothetical protein
MAATTAQNRLDHRRKAAAVSEGNERSDQEGPAGSAIPGIPPSNQDDSSGGGVVALIVAVLFAPIGLVLGVIALRKANATPGRPGRGLAIAAVAVGGALTAIAVVAVAVSLLGSDGDGGGGGGSYATPAQIEPALRSQLQDRVSGLANGFQRQYKVGQVTCVERVGQAHTFDCQAPLIHPAGDVYNDDQFLVVQARPDGSWSTVQ